MSDPNDATQASPHPVSGHRTPAEIAKDEAGRIGQPDEDTPKVAPKKAKPNSEGGDSPLAPGSRRPGERG